MRAVCLLSGGMDSAVALSIAKDRGYDLFPLSLNYGQRTKEKEASCAKKISQKLGIRKLQLISLPFLGGLGKSLLTFGGEDTYVPFRNSILISLATAYAEAISASAIFIGVSSVDTDYPDTRPDYIQAMQEVIRIGSKRRNISLETPLLYLSKADIVLLGLKFGTPFELTWSCYFNNEKPCGNCDSCRKRREGFRKAGLNDPIEG
jgi:7-cyano-7-deazaguanine synthase